MQDTVFGSVSGELDHTGPAIDCEQWECIAAYVESMERKEKAQKEQAARASLGTIAGRKNARKR
jgi:hypothetical protein